MQNIFKKNNALKSVIVGAVITVSTMLNIASAGLIQDTNKNSFIDTSTGFEWMDFGVNNRLSFNEVKQELGRDGKFNGWRIANIDETANLWVSIFGYDKARLIGNEFIEALANTTAVQVNWQAMGYNLINNTGNRQEQMSMGMFYGSTGISLLAMIKDTVDSSRLHTTYVGFNDLDKFKSLIKEDNNPQLSTMLIRNTATVKVNEPVSLTIFTLGLLAIALRRTNKT